MENIKYYKDNPYLDLLRVTTFEGEVEYKKNCKLIGDLYFVKGKHIFYDKKAGDYVFEPGLFDYGTQKPVNSFVGLLYGIVKIVKDKPVFGFFTKDPFNTCCIKTNAKNIYCVNSELLKGTVYLEDYSSGLYYDTTGWNEKAIEKLSKKRLTVSCGNNRYNIEDNRHEYNDAVAFFEKSPIKIDKDLRRVAYYIKDITYGLEVEVISGMLPEHILNKYGLVICKDGSIMPDGEELYPPEFVSVPYKGAKGLQAIRNFVKEISLRSDISIRCSLHLHIGNIPIDRIFIVSLYSLCVKIQKDVFKMFPYYKTEPEGYTKDNKNYCQPLQDFLCKYSNREFNKYINRSFKDIYYFISGGRAVDWEWNKKHKRNPWGQHKWNIHSRYYWVNFINLFFSKRDTIEFRIHTPTLNSDKIINWLLMCNAIIKFAQKNVISCIDEKPIAFQQVLNYYKDNFKSNYSDILSERLINYYNNRVELFKKDFKEGDYVSKKYFKQDLIEDFNITKV